VSRSYRVGVQGGWTGAMRIVVIFLCIQEEEWDVLYIRKGEWPGPGRGPSCVGSGRSGAVGQGVAGAGVPLSLLILLLLLAPEGLLGHTQGTGEDADRALPQLSGLWMMGSSLLMSRYPTTKSTCGASILIPPTTRTFMCSPLLP
jgi:hypothetical protein